MNRRWRGEASERLGTVVSYQTFTGGLPALVTSDRRPPLASPADLYAVQCALHAKGNSPEVRSCDGFIFFLNDSDYMTSSAPDGPVDQQEGAVPGPAGREVVIPVSTSYSHLCPGTMYGLITEAGAAEAGHAVLAFVGSDGGVAMQRVFNRVQPPEEGKGKADETLLPQVKD